MYLRFICLFMTCVIITTNASFLKKELRPRRVEVSRENILIKRNDDLLQVPLDSTTINYEIELEISSSKMSIHALIDTGSSDLVVMDSSNYDCDGSTLNLTTPKNQWLGSNEPPIDSVNKTLSNSLKIPTLTVDNYSSGFRIGAIASNVDEYLSHVIQTTANREPEQSRFNYENLNVSPSSYTIFNCKYTGKFNSSESKTIEFLDLPFITTYLDDTFAEGSYVKDVVFLDGAELKGLQFGLATSSSFISTSILGLGFQSLEAGYHYGLNQYPNLPRVLKEQGYVETVAYSVDLNEKDPVIVFGGVNLKKAKNETMYKLPILSGLPVGEFGVVGDLMEVTLNSFGLESGMPMLNGSLRALFDTGTTTSILSEQMVESILQSYPFEQINEDIFIITEDEIKEQSVYLNFQGVEIGVKLTSFFNQIEFKNGTLSNYYKFDTYGKDLKIGDNIVIGKDIMRNMYFLFDLENKEICISELMPNVEDNDIQTIFKNETLEGIVKAPLYDNKYDAANGGLKWNRKANSQAGWQWLMSYIK